MEGLARETILIGAGDASKLGDPDGNRVELFVDTPWYITQPTREPLDLSLSDADLLAAVEAFARTQPGFRPRAEWSAEMRRRIEAAMPA